MSTTASANELQLENLINVFNIIFDNKEKWDNDAIYQSNNLLAKLLDFKFLLWHTFQMQLNAFYNACNWTFRWNLKETFTEIKHSTDDAPLRKKTRPKTQIYYKKTSNFQIIDTVLTQERDAGREDYKFLELLGPKLKNYFNSFPMQHVESLTNKCLLTCEFKNLISKLECLYVFRQWLQEKRNG